MGGGFLRLYIGTFNLELHGRWVLQMVDIGNLFNFSIALFFHQRADGMTTLHLAAQSGKVDAVRFLLETKKIRVNVKVKAYNLSDLRQVFRSTSPQSYCVIYSSFYIV